MTEGTVRHPACQFQSDKRWLNRQHHPDGTIKKPEELEKEMRDPPCDIDSDIFDRIHGSMIGLALGDTLGAFVEFRPHDYLVEHPVETLKGGGTWGLAKGQFTDDTSMALCLANSLITRQDYVPYDQLVRYKWWHRDGYMSSTGNCFDIGSATRQSLAKFESRQKEFAEKHHIPLEQLDYLSDPKLLKEFDEYCSEEGVAGNGPLMRLAPVPLFFHKYPVYAVKYSGDSGKITHGDDKAIDACRYYAALIVAALNGVPKVELLSKNFYKNHKEWFGEKTLHDEIKNIAKGSYQKIEGYAGGIRGKGYIVDSLKAALWAFWSDKDSFQTGVLNVINLGDDTDTTAAIYGQLAGAYYGYKNLPEKWKNQIYAKDFIQCLSKWIMYEGKRWAVGNVTMPVDSSSEIPAASSFEEKTNLLTALRRFSPHDKVITLQPSFDEQQASTPINLSENFDIKPSTEQLYFHKNIKSTEDVYQWISSMNNACHIYANIFKDNDIDAYWLLNQIDDEYLVKLGIENADHTQIIRHEIEKLKQQCTKKYPKGKK